MGEMNDEIRQELWDVADLKLDIIAGQVTN
jgi:hypothetical protein